MSSLKIEKCWTEEVWVWIYLLYGISLSCPDGVTFVCPGYTTAEELTISSWAEAYSHYLCVCLQCHKALTNV